MSRLAALTLITLCACSTRPAGDAATEGDTGTSTTTDASSSTGGATQGETTGESSTGAETGISTGGEESSSSTDDEWGETGDEPPELCEHFAGLDLSDAFATPEGDAWTPGTTISVGATLTNSTPWDFTWYPGIIVESDHDGVTSQNPENQLFAILVDMSGVLGVTFDADQGIAPGTEVTFTITAATINQECFGDSLEIVAVVE